MRLYHQPGLSNRVVSALRNRLERVLLGMSADGDARAHGNGAHGEEGGEHRGRSRSRGRAATETHGRPGLEEDVPQEQRYRHWRHCRKKLRSQL